MHITAARILRPCRRHRGHSTVTSDHASHRDRAARHMPAFCGPGVKACQCRQFTIPFRPANTTGIGFGEPTPMLVVLDILPSRLPPPRTSSPQKRQEQAQVRHMISACLSRVTAEDPGLDVGRQPRIDPVVRRQKNGITRANTYRPFACCKISPAAQQPWSNTLSYRCIRDPENSPTRQSHASRNWFADQSSRHHHTALNWTLDLVDTPT